MALPMLSEAQKEDILRGSKDYVISIDPSINEEESPSYGYIYVADMTKTPMEILETYQITRNGLKRIIPGQTSEGERDIHSKDD